MSDENLELQLIGSAVALHCTRFGCSIQIGRKTSVALTSLPEIFSFSKSHLHFHSCVGISELSSSSCPLHHRKSNMVKFRGINVSIVSQFDIRKLPEFSPCESNDPFHQEGLALHPDNNSVASCYVPIYPGSQIWFEYSIDAPHPPDASYFFKLLHNGQVVTSWDCTAKYGYHGNATYSIECIGIDNLTGAPLVRRNAFKFLSRYLREEGVGPFDDCIEFRIHRIEHRQRIPIEPMLKGTRAIEDSHSSELW
jgi:hypothetical protein